MFSGAAVNDKPDIEQSAVLAVVAVCGAATEVKTAVCLAEDSVAAAGEVAVASSGGIAIVSAGRASARVPTAACLTVFLVLRRAFPLEFVTYLVVTAGIEPVTAVYTWRLSLLSYGRHP